MIFKAYIKGILREYTGYANGSPKEMQRKTKGNKENQRQQRKTKENKGETKETKEMAKSLIHRGAMHRHL